MSWCCLYCSLCEAGSSGEGGWAGPRCSSVMSYSDREINGTEIPMM